MVEIKKAVFDDCQAFNRWENIDEVIKYLSISKGRSMEDSIREFIQRENDDSSRDFAVYYGKKIVGRAFLSRYDKNTSSIDITRIYIGDESDRNKGIGTALMVVLLKYCFIELNLNRVTLDYLDGNPAKKIYETMGFVNEGVAREAGFKDGVYNNFNLMSMLKKEYKARYLPE